MNLYTAGNSVTLQYLSKFLQLVISKYKL